MRNKVFLFVLLTICYLSAFGQEEQQTLTYANIYLQHKIDGASEYQSLYNKRIKQLLRRLDKKEKHLLKKITEADSTRSIRLKTSADFESISKITPDSIKNTNFSRRSNRLIDSLRRVQQFIDQQNAISGINLPTEQHTEAINALKQNSDYEQQLNILIKRRVADLKDAANGITGLQSIDKQSFYTMERLKSYKQMAQSQDDAEAKALSYLEGSPGFEQAISGTTNSADNNSIQQTQQLLANSLQQKFSGSLPKLGAQASEQINSWQNKLADTRNTVSQLNNQFKQKVTGFKVNTMRCQPFSQRLEKQFNIQTTRATKHNPALLDASFMLGFRQNARLSYGTGIALNIGLGENWTDICLSFQGLGYRTFLQWKWQYGLSAYAGYERLYQMPAPAAEIPSSYSIHKTKQYKEGVLLGLAMNYKISERFNGGLQLLTDIWWREKGLRSPIILRISNISK